MRSKTNKVEHPRYCIRFYNGDTYEGANFFRTLDQAVEFCNKTDSCWIPSRLFHIYRLGRPIKLEKKKTRIVRKHEIEQWAVPIKVGGTKKKIKKEVA